MTIREVNMGHSGLQDGIILTRQKKKLLDFKVGELPRWIPMQDSTPKGTAELFQRGYYLCYNNYVNVKKGDIAGTSMVLAATAVVIGNSDMRGYTSTTEVGPLWRHILCF